MASFVMDMFCAIITAFLVGIFKPYACRDKENNKYLHDILLRIGLVEKDPALGLQCNRYLRL